MYTQPIWEGLRKVFSANNKKLDLAKVSTFTLELKKHLSNPLADELHKAIMEGPVHTDSEITKGDYRGTFTNRTFSMMH
jgi:hypothetical protein